MVRQDRLMRTTKEHTAAVGSAASANRAIGAMFFTLLGSGWLLFGILAGYGMKPLAVWTVMAGTLLLFCASVRQFRRNRAARAAEPESQESKRANRIFNAVNAIQWISVFVVSALLAALGHKEWILPAIILIVGIHFFPLAVAFKVPRHYVTGTAMTLLAIVYPFLSNGGPRSPLGCLGAGIILWASAVAALVRPA